MTTPKVFDPWIVANEVQSLSSSDEPIASLVKEALDVIDEALETHGYVYTGCSLNPI